MHGLKVKKLATRRVRGGVHQKREGLWSGSSRGQQHDEQRGK